MLSFHNKPKLKNHFVKQMKHHIKQDNLIQGSGWENGRGCFIGCSIEDYDHEKWAKLTGCGGKWLGKLFDKIFEGLNVKDTIYFAANVYPSIPVGKDLTKVKHQFIIFILDQNIETLKDSKYSGISEVRKAIQQCRILHESFLLTKVWDESAAESAESAAESAESAAWSAESAARSAAESAARSAESAAWSAESAAESAGSAGSAAWSAESAARSAAWSAARSAESAARSAAYKKYADKLLELLRGV